MPVPESATVCGEPVALSATLSDAAKPVADAGVKVTAMLQLALMASEAPQALTSAKSVGLVPVSEMLEMVSGAVPVLESATTVVLLVVFTV